MHEEHLATIRSWVGRSYSEMRCWDVITDAFHLRGIELPGDYFAALPLFRMVHEPEPWDVVPIANHEIAIVVNHVGLMLDGDEYAHSVEGAGVVIHPLVRMPWFDRIATTRDGRKGFLRLRQ